MARGKFKSYQIALNAEPSMGLWRINLDEALLTKRHNDLQLAALITKEAAENVKPRLLLFADPRMVCCAMSMSQLKYFIAFLETALLEALEVTVCVNNEFEYYWKPHLYPVNRKDAVWRAPSEYLHACVNPPSSSLITGTLCSIIQPLSRDTLLRCLNLLDLACSCAQPVP